MARPPGCSFRGAQPTEGLATVNGLNVDPMKVIVDSGSDITLMSQKALDKVSRPLKLKGGQDIEFIQVTGKASISGLVTLNLFSHTSEDR
jgi:hypothetical protein